MLSRRVADLAESAVDAFADLVKRFVEAFAQKPELLWYATRKRRQRLDLLDLCLVLGFAAGPLFLGRRTLAFAFAAQVILENNRQQPTAAE